MSATAYRTALAFEANFSAAAFALLQASGLPAFFPREFTGERLPLERVDLSCGGFARQSEQRAVAPSGLWFHTHFSGTLAFTIVTPRADRAAAGRHAGYVSTLRWLHAHATGAYTAQYLPWYQVIALEETASTVDEIDDSTETDRTTLHFTVEFGLLPQWGP